MITSKFEDFLRDPDAEYEVPGLPGTVKKIRPGSVDQFLDKSILVMGSSNCGKSTVINDILTRLAEYVPIPIVFTPQGTISDYPNILQCPEVCIRRDAPTNAALQRIWNMQMHRVKIYNNAKDGHFMYNLAKKLDIFTPDTIDRLEEYRANSEHIDRAKYNGTFASLVPDIKAAIVKNKAKFLENRDLTPDERDVVGHPNIQPRICIVIDDYSKAIDGLLKQPKENTESTLSDIMTKGRHQYVTIIVVVHSRTDIKKSARELFQTNIFCTENSCGSTSDKAIRHISGHVFNECIYRWKNVHNGEIVSTEPPNLEKWQRLSISKYKFVMTSELEKYVYYVDYKKLQATNIKLGCKHLSSL